MNKLKRRLHLFCGLLQAIAGIFLLVGGLFTAFKWVIQNKTNEFLPDFYQKASKIITSPLLLKIAVPIAAAVVGLLLFSLARKLLKNPYDPVKKKFNQRNITTVLSVAFNALCAYVAFKGFENIYGIVGGVFFAVVAALEAVSLFPNYVDVDSPSRFSARELKQQQQMATEIQKIYVSPKEWDFRFNELIRLYKRKKLDQADFFGCIDSLMRLPVQADITYKMGYLKKLYRKRLIDQNAYSSFLGAILTSPSTSNLRTKTRYLEKMRNKSLIDDATYGRIIQQIMMSVY